MRVDLTLTLARILASQVRFRSSFNPHWMHSTRIVAVASPQTFVIVLIANRLELLELC